MKRRIAVLLMLEMLPWAGLNAQQTATTTFRVSAKVEEICDVTAPDLALGNYTAQGNAPLQAATLLHATCTPNTTYNVGLNKGMSPGATIHRRKLVSGAQTSNFQLYPDSARSAISGNATGMDTVTGVGTGMPVDHTLFGGVPAAQVVPPGEHGDTVSVRIYY